MRFSHLSLLISQNYTLLQMRKCVISKMSKCGHTKIMGKCVISKMCKCEHTKIMGKWVISKIYKCEHTKNNGQMQVTTLWFNSVLRMCRERMVSLARTIASHVKHWEIRRELIRLLPETRANASHWSIKKNSSWMDFKKARGSQWLNACTTGKVTKKDNQKHARHRKHLEERMFSGGSTWIPAGS